MEQATRIILQKVQAEAFSKELYVFRGKQRDKINAVSRKSQLYTLDPFLDENRLIRGGGCLKRSHISDKVKHPILVPLSRYATSLMIKYYHEKVRYSERGITLNAR